MLLLGVDVDFETRISKEAEISKWDLMAQTRSRMESSGAEGNLNCGDPVPEVLEEKNINMLTGDNSFDIFVKKNVAAFCPSPKYMTDAKLKSCGLSVLAEEITRQPNIDCLVWLLMTTLIEIYNEKELSKEKYTM